MKRYVLPSNAKRKALPSISKRSKFYLPLKLPLNDTQMRNLIDVDKQ